MAKNKKTASKAADPAKPQNKLQLLLMTSAALAALVVTISFCSLALIDRQIISQNNIEAQSQRLADGQAALLGQVLTQLQLRLSSIGASSQWLEALQQKDPQRIQRYQQELTRTFPEASSIQLLPLGPLGIASLDRKSYPLRNNIELDLLRHVSNGETVEPEAYRHDKQWLFSLAEPVKSSDKEYADGAILITLNEQYLKSLLGQLDNSLGKTTLIQQFNQKEHIIAIAGNSRSNFSVTTETSVSHWKIRFTPSAELIAASSHSASLIWIFMVLSLIAIIGGALYSINSLQKTLATELGKLFIANKKTSFVLPGFAAAAEKIHSIAAAKATVKTEPAPPGPSHQSDAKPSLEPSPESPSTETGPTAPRDIPATIFRAYDIRGLADQQLTDDTVYAIGLAIGSEALDQGQQTVVVAADGRHSSPRIRNAMIQGLQASGRDVIDIGTVPTPLMYFATHQLGTQSGVMITGSHNPSEYNGIKIVIGGHALSGNAIQGLLQRINSNNLASGQGELHAQDIKQAYIDYIINDVAIAQPLKIVIDAGNGVSGVIAPQLFEELGCEVIQLYCDVNGDFPNHHPDPSVEANLSDLKNTVQQQKADLGIAFDGDGDRLGVVTASGKSVAADRLLMLLAQDVVSRNPGADVIFDVKCTRNLNTLISNYGGRPIMWKTGHSFMKEKMAETGALLGGEFSGHIFFKERWFGFDDGMYAAARLIEILSTTDPDLDVQLKAFPESIGSPEIKVETGEEQKFSIIEQLVSNGQFDEGKISTLDGVRVDYPDGWGLVRASNTTPMLVLRFEADTSEAMHRIQNQFKEQLGNIDNTLQFDF